MTGISFSINSIPRQIFSAISQISFKHILTTTIALEALFYTSMKIRIIQEGPLKFTNRIRSMTINHIHEIQKAFNILNVGYALVYTVSLIRLDNRYSKEIKNAILVFTSNYDLLSKVVGIVSAVTYALFAFISRKYSQSLLSTLRGSSGEVTTSTNRPFQFYLARYLHLTQLTLNIALLYFSKPQDRFWLKLNAICSSYNLIKNFQIEWLNFSVSEETPQEHDFSKKTLRYNILALPVLTGECAVCLEEKELVTFCANHFFDRDCLKEIATGKSKDFMQILVHEKIVSENSNPTYVVAIPEFNLPTCPLCREIPHQNNVDIVFSDRWHGDIAASVNIFSLKTLNSLMQEHNLA